MTILTRYIALTFFRHLVVTLVSLVGLVVVANLFGDLDEALTSWNGFFAFADRTLRGLPAVVELLLPMVVLLATLFTFVGLSRSAELTTIKIGGCGPWRLLWPFLLVLLPLGGVAYFNQNYLHPWLNASTVDTAGGGPIQDVWRATGDSFYYVGRLDRPTGQIHLTRAFHADPQGQHFIQAQELNTGSYGPAGWRFPETRSYERQGDHWHLQPATTEDWPPESFPNVFAVTDQDPHHMPFIELYQHAQRLEQEGRRVAIHWLEWHYKISVIFALFVMALLGGALVQSSTRRSRVGLETSVTVLVGVLFWITTQIFLLLGKGEFVAPAIAAWAPAATFFLLGYGTYRASF